MDTDNRLLEVEEVEEEGGIGEINGDGLRLALGN